MVQNALTGLTIAALCCACASAPPRPTLPRSAPVVLSDSVRALAMDSTRLWSCDSVDHVPVLLSIPRVQLPSAGDPYPNPTIKSVGPSRVVVQFVIDRQGKPETETIKALPPFDPSYAHAAIVALLEARFQPARIGDRSVRVLVNLPFDFPRRGS